MVKVEGTIMLRLVIEVLRVGGSSPYERPLDPNSLNSLETIGWADGIESTSPLRYLSTTTGQAEKIFEERADMNHHYHCDTTLLAAGGYGGKRHYHDSLQPNVQATAVNIGAPNTSPKSCKAMNDGRLTSPGTCDHTTIL